MASITRITIHCIRQEDWTGSDDLDFYEQKPGQAVLSGSGHTTAPLSPSLDD